ncbi:MAG: hypothetical protein WBX25_36365, partial [Rhodomicrobium sp.]
MERLRPIKGLRRVQRGFSGISGRRLREIGDLVIGGVCAGFCRFGFRKEIGDGLSSRLAAALP